MKINATQYTKEKICQALRNNRRGLTLIQICNQTSLLKEHVKPILQELIEQQHIYPAKRGKSTIYLINQQSEAAAPPPPPADNFVVAAYSDDCLLIEQNGRSMILTAPQTKQLLAFAANWRQS